MHNAKLTIKDRIVVSFINRILSLRRVTSIRGNAKNIHKIRKDLERLASIVAKKHPNAVVTKDMCAGLKIEEIRFKGVGTDRILLYTHGGGYAFGSPSTHRAMISRMAWSMKANAIVPDYRLAPENPYPAGLDDIVKLYKHLVESSVPPEKIIVAGESAGGGLTLALLQRIKAEKLPMPAVACVLSPWADLTLSGESMKSNQNRDKILSKDLLNSFADLYAPYDIRKDPMVSPSLSGDYTGMPPMIIQVGASEVLVDESRVVAKAVKDAGGDVILQEWRGMQHFWHFNFRIMKSARNAVRALGTFVNEKMA